MRNQAPLSNNLASQAREIIEETTPIPGYCFANAQRAAKQFDDATYVEGLVYFGGLERAFDHAWVELQDKVAELTYEECPHTPDDSVYVGVAYDIETVNEVLQERKYDCTISHCLKRREVEAERSS